MNTPRHAPRESQGINLRLELSNPTTNPKVGFLYNGKRKNLDTLFTPSDQESQEINTYVQQWYLCIGVRTQWDDYPQYMKDFFEEYEEYVVSGQEKIVQRENSHEYFVLIPLKNQAVEQESQNVSTNIWEILKMEDDGQTYEDIIADIDPNSMKNVLKDVGISWDILPQNPQK